MFLLHVLVTWLIVSIGNFWSLIGVWIYEVKYDIVQQQSWSWQSLQRMSNPESVQEKVCQLRRKEERGVAMQNFVQQTRRVNIFEYLTRSPHPANTLVMAFMVKLSNYMQILKTDKRYISNQLYFQSIDSQDQGDCQVSMT